MLRDALSYGRPSSEFLERITRALPHPSLVLAEVASTVFELLCEVPAKDQGQHVRRLNGLAHWLSHAGRPEDALALSQKTVNICRRLIKKTNARNISRTLLYLWHKNQVHCLASRQKEEALTAINETVDIYRRSVFSSWRTHLFNLAGALSNKAERLSDLGRSEDALAVNKEAVNIYRRLSSTAPEELQSNIALALINQIKYMGQLGQQEAALPAMDEAMNVLSIWPKCNLTHIYPDLRYLLTVNRIC